MIEFDVILDRIGHFGRYQLMLTLMTYWLGIPAGLHNIASVFYAPPIEYRCKVPPIDNSTVYPDLNETQILNLTTPLKGDSGKYDTCQRYGYDLSECDGTLSCVNKSASPINCDMGYEYDTSVFTSTIDTEWSVICDQKILNTAVTSFYFAGMWAGAIISGYLSDYIGRKPTMMICNTGTIIFGVVTAFSPWYAMFAVARFFVALFSHGSFLIMCIYVMEISGKYRTPTGINAHTAFAVGYALNSFFSYFIRDWRYFYLAISLTPIPYAVFHFFVAESPRWHFSNSRDEEGKTLSYKFAKHNKKELTSDVWKEAESEQKNSDQQKYSSLDLFKTPRMRLVTLNVMFSWFAISLMYYGLSLNAGSLAGNIFINNALNAVMEIVGYIIVTFTMDRLGRRVLLVASFLLGGFACIASMLCNEFGERDNNDALIITGVAMAFIGKIGAGAGFGIIYNYTAELYPTVIRSNGLGVGSMAARWGSILAPFVILIQDYASWVPSTVFGVISIIAGVLALLFPETNNKTMPQTIEEAELFYKGKLESDLDKEMSDFSTSSSEGESNKAYDVEEIGNATKF